LAAQIAENPLAPYAGPIYWDYQLQPANQVLAPPVMLYWTAAAMRLLGDETWLWKLSLWPLHLLLVAALFSLLHRFTGPAAMPLLWMTTLGPALLPSTNLMLDVPALALSLTAVAVFLRASDRGSWTAAVLAGMIAGLALQTKYTAFTVPLAMLAWGLLQRRLGLALTAVGIAAAVFVAWELYVALGQGQSHFLFALQHRSGSTASRIRHLASPLFTMTAAIAPGTGLVAVFARTRSRRWLVTGVVALVVGAAVLGVTPAETLVLSRDAASGQPRFDLEILLYLALTVSWWAALIAASGPLIPQLRAGSLSGPGSASTLLLMSWLGVEVLGYFVLSPFPAARRMLGLAVVMTLLAGRSALATGVVRSRALWLATAGSAACGILVSYVDLREAEASREVAEAIAATAKRFPSGTTAWFSGAWSFPFYAQRQGLQPVLHGQSALKRGDLLVLAEQPRKRVDFHPERAPLELVSVVSVEADVPWQTVPCYYGGRTVLRHLEGARIRAVVYRVLEEFVPSAYGELPALH
jgi:hypothetical protein